MVVVVLLMAFVLQGSSLRAKDFGVHGVIYSINEEDPIVLIQQKLKRMEDSGELERHQRDLQKKTKAAVERPKPIEGITKAEKSRIFYYDPTYIVAEDLKDHTRRVFYKKRTKINPLETVTLSQDLLFFDGDDAEQKAWAQAKMQKSVVSDQNDKNDKKVRLILVRGAPLALSKELGVPVYFDQGGLLTKKLGIQHIPASVTQEDLRLRIEEIALEETKK